MHPVLAKIGSFTVYSYGVMIALGFGLGIYLAARRAHIFGVTREDLLDLALFILIGGIAGARLFHVALNYDYFKSRPLEVILLSRGGLAYYGAFAGGLAAGLVFKLWKKIPFWNTADLLAPYVALGQSIGRIGCFLNGCCYGGAASDDFPLRVHFPHDTVARHPVQAYSSLILFALFVALRSLRERRRFAGEVFLAYAIAYPFQRFFIDFLRDDTPRAVFDLTVSQLMSVPLFAASVVIYLLLYRRWKNTRSL